MEEDGRIVTGQSADTDTVVASAKAYVAALNRLVVRRGKTGTDRKEVSYKNAGCTPPTRKGSTSVRRALPCVVMYRAGPCQSKCASPCGVAPRPAAHRAQAAAADRPRAPVSWDTAAQSRRCLTLRARRASQTRANGPLCQADDPHCVDIPGARAGGEIEAGLRGTGSYTHIGERRAEISRHEDSAFSAPAPGSSMHGSSWQGASKMKPAEKPRVRKEPEGKDTKAFVSPSAA
jgi:hypothetical protein